MTPPGNARTWDRLFALILALAGLFVIWEGSQYSFGTLARIGPGFFPIVIGVGIVICGLVIFLLTDGENVDLRLPSLRPLILLPASIVAFTFLLERFGIVPAAVALALLSAQADTRPNARTTGLIMVLVLALAAGLFHFGFGIPVPLARWEI